MGRIKIVDTQPEHAALMAGSGLRVSDLVEMVKATGRCDVKAEIERSVGLSAVSRTALLDGYPIAIYGVTECGSIWMLGTEEADNHPIAFGRISKAFMAEMQAIYTRLYNYVDVKNIKSIEWLKWLGFTICEAQPYGAGKLPFHYFEWSNKCAHQ